MKKYILIFAVVFLCLPFLIHHDPEKPSSNEESKKEINITKNYLMGKFDPAQEKNFILISREYTPKDNLYLRKETYQAFIKMQKAAQANGVDLNIVSATRNFDYQKILWENKYQKTGFQEAIKYSALPGTSRHHWGTDIDINSVEPKYFETEKGAKEYKWLKENADAFGFCQPYNEERKTGYEEEKWHWSYFPISSNLTKEYKNLINLEDLKGFLGEKYVIEIDPIANYVLSINPDCLQNQK